MTDIIAGVLLVLAFLSIWDWFLSVLDKGE